MEILGRGEGHRDPRREKSSEGQVFGDHPLPPPQCCPRCNSTNIKFSYFNNYNTSQPRYFCKACRRYWTQGGNLRNVPIGGGSRMNKRRRASSSSSSSSNGGRQREDERVRVELPIQPRPLQNLTGLASGILRNQSQPMRVLSPMGNFPTRGEFISTLATMHSHLNQPPRMINQVSVNLDSIQYVRADGGSDSNTTLLEGLNLPATHIQHPNEAFQPQQYVVQNLVDSATTSASNTNLCNNFPASTVANGGGIDSSINPN